MLVQSNPFICSSGTAGQLQQQNTWDTFFDLTLRPRYKQNNNFWTRTSLLAKLSPYGSYNYPVDHCSDTKIRTEFSPNWQILERIDAIHLSKL